MALSNGTFTNVRESQSCHLAAKKHACKHNHTPCRSSALLLMTFFSANKKKFQFHSRKTGKLIWNHELASSTEREIFPSSDYRFNELFPSNSRKNFMLASHDHYPCHVLSWRILQCEIINFEFTHFTTLIHVPCFMREAKCDIMA